jgi:hypothetical protein
MQQFFSLLVYQFLLLSWLLFTAQHVSGVFPPFIRSSMTAVAASSFTFLSQWHSCCVRSRAGRPGRRRTQDDYHHDTKVKPEAATAIMISWWWAGKLPKHVELWTNIRIINWKIVASGWWFIWFNCKTPIQKDKCCDITAYDAVWSGI